MDTTQFDFTYIPGAPLFHFTNPGSRGYMLNNQLDMVEKIVQEAKEKGEILIFSGHHNWDQLSIDTRDRLGQIFKKMDHGAVYLSAHTHQGFWSTHTIANKKLLELNISSMADWPLDARKVSFSLGRDKQTIKVTAGSATLASRAPKTEDALYESWLALTCNHADVAAMSTDLIEETDIKSFIREQEYLVSKHNEGRGGIGTMLAHFWYQKIQKDKEKVRIYLYHDNYNDNRIAIEVFLSMIKKFPAVMAWAKTQPIPASKQCVRPTLDTQLECELTQSPQPTSATVSSIVNNYHTLVETVSHLQAAIDTITIQSEPGIVRLMACSHVVAAHWDSVAGGRGPKQSKLKLEDAFFEESKVASPR